MYGLSKVQYILTIGCSLFWLDIACYHVLHFNVFWYHKLTLYLFLYISFLLIDIFRFVKWSREYTYDSNLWWSIVSAVLYITYAQTFPTKLSMFMSYHIVFVFKTCLYFYIGRGHLIPWSDFLFVWIRKGNN